MTCINVSVVVSSYNYGPQFQYVSSDSSVGTAARLRDGLSIFPSSSRFQ